LSVLSIGPGQAIELPPKLSLSYISANQIRISWPAATTHYQLEISEFLKAPGNWQSSSLKPALENNEYYFLLKPEKSALFFRLRSP
jgi:hypothetical protein